jgi:4-hydroxy-4-methyl-2-oxoglutarate aldolase
MAYAWSSAPMRHGVLAAAQAREADEAVKRERLARGESSLDIYDLRRRLDDQGLKYI